MSDEAPLPPQLPSYGPPKDRVQAALPPGLEIKKMPGTMNRMISKMLAPKLKARMPKLKTPKMKSPHGQKQKSNKHRLKVT